MISKVIVFILFCLLIILPVKVSALNAQQTIFSLSLSDMNCNIVIGVDAIPNGPTSYLSYLYGDDALIKGRLVNYCPSINKISLYFFNSTNHTAFNWTFYNVSEDDYVDFNTIVRNNNLEMSFFPGIFDMAIGESRYYNSVLNFNSSFFLKWNTSAVTVINRWDRKIDFPGFVPEISDDIYFDISKNISAFIIGYQNLDVKDPHNFIFLEKCEINGVNCLSKMLLTDDWTGFEVNLTNKTLNTDNRLSLTYYIEKYADKYDGLLFPFDEIKTKIEFPYVKKVVYYDGSTEDLNYVSEMPLMFSIPSGFIFDKMASKNYTGPNECNNTDYVGYSLPVKPSVSSNNTTRISVPQYCLNTNETCLPQDTFVTLYVKPLIREPQIQMTGENGKIIYLDKIDSNCPDTPLGLVFVRGDIYFLLYFLTIFIGILFFLKALYFKKDLLNNFLEYSTVGAFTVIGQFLVFPRPFQITLVEETLIIMGIAIIIESLIIRKIKLNIKEVKISIMKGEGNNFKDVGTLILASFLGAFASKVLDLYMNNVNSWVGIYYIFWFIAFAGFSYMSFNFREFLRNKWNIILLLLLFIIVISPYFILLLLK